MDLFVPREEIKKTLFGIEFMYRVPTGEEEVFWVKEYGSFEKTKDNITGEEKFVFVEDARKKNRCYLRNIVDASFPVEQIEKFFQVKKTFKELTQEERVQLLCSLKGKQYQELVKFVDEVVSPSEGTKDI